MASGCSASCGSSSGGDVARAGALALAGLLISVALAGTPAEAFQNRRGLQAYQRMIADSRREQASIRDSITRLNRQARYPLAGSGGNAAVEAVGLLGRTAGRLAAASSGDGDFDDPPTVPRPLTRAEKIRILEQNAAAGDVEAHLLLEQMHREGHGVPRDPARALQHLEKAAALGHLPSQRLAAMRLYTGTDAPEDATRAARWFEAAALQGDAESQYAIGVLHALGEGVPQDDARAVAWYRKAAAAGSRGGQHAMGIRHLDGKGVPQDDAEAMAWFRRAAEQGYAPAQYNLGSMYRDGRGAPKGDESRTIAAGLYLQAARQGLAEAQYMLGLMHTTGVGVPRDLRQAEHWWAKAAEQGDAESAQLLEGLRRHVRQNGY
jgi:TPR repeat protein